MQNNSEILIYQNAAGEISLDVRLEGETVWLGTTAAAGHGKVREIADLTLVIGINQGR